MGVLPATLTFLCLVQTAQLRSKQGGLRSYIHIIRNLHILILSIENSDLSKLQLYFMIKQKFIIKLFISPASWVVISTRRHSTVSKRSEHHQMQCSMFVCLASVLETVIGNVILQPSADDQCRNFIIDILTTLSNPAINESIRK